MPESVPATPSSAAPAPRGRDAKSLPTLVSELWELTVAYLKQETIVPIKGLGRFIAFGVAGSVLLAIGLVLLVLAALRALQTETGGTFDGNWSWLPYLMTLVGCGIVLGLAARAIGKGRGVKKGRV